MSGGTVTIGDMIAVLRARDELSPAVRAASQVSVQELGKMQAAVTAANAEVKALQKQWLDMANAPAVQSGIEVELGQAILKAQDASAKLKDLKSDIAEAMRPPPEDITPVVESTTSAFGDLGDMVTRITERLLVYASIRGVISATEATVDYGLQIERLSDQLGMGADRIQEFSYASIQTAVPVTTITQAVTQLQRKIDLQDGGLIKALDDLGIKWSDLRAMKPEDQFDLIVSKLSQVTDQTRFAGDAAELFNSRSGSSIASVIKQWEALKQQAHDSNVVLDNEQVSMLADIEKGWDLAYLKAKTYFGAVIAYAANGDHNGNQTKDATGKPLSSQPTTVSGDFSLFDTGNLDQQIQQQVSALAKTLSVPLSFQNAGVDPKSLLPDLSGDSKQSVANLFEVQKEIQELTSSGSQLEAQNRKNAEAIAVWNQAYADLQPYLESSRYDGTIQSLLKLGATTHDTAIYFDGASGNLRTMTMAVDAAKKSMDDAAKSQKELQAVSKIEFDGKSLEAMTGELEKIGFTSNNDIAVVKQMLSEFKINDDAYNALAKQDADYQGSISKSKYDYQRQLVSEWQNIQEGQLDYSVDNWEKAYNEIGVVAKDKLQDIALNEQVALTDMHAQELTWSNEFLKTLSDIPSLFQRAATGGGGFSGFGTALFSSVGSDIGSKLFAAGGPLNGLGNSLTSTMTDTFGQSFGDAFGMALPGIGTAIGALMPKLFDLFKSLFGGRSTADQVAQDIAPMFGGLSDAVQKQIVDSVSQFGGSNYAATLANLGSIIAEHPIDMSNIDMYMGKVHDVFSMIDQGHMTVAQASTALDSVFPQLATAATDSYGRISQSLKDLIALNTQYGTDSQAIATFMQGQGTNAITGYDAVVQGTVGSYNTLMAAVNAAKGSLQAMAVQGVTSGDQFDQATQAMQTAMTNLNKAGVTPTVQSLKDLGVQALASFTAAVASGTSEVNALKQISPALTTLQTGYQNLGIDVDDVAVKALLMRNSIVTANPDLINAIGGLTQEMVALDNMGLMNVSTLQSMERTGLSAYQQLQAAVKNLGGTDTDALSQMQDWLHQAQQEATLLGVPLDDNTQSLIDQSKQLGIWKDTGTDATDKLIAGMTTLVDKVSALIDNLNGVTTSITNIPTSKTIDIYTNYHTSSDGSPDYGGPQAMGGDYLVTRPTLFLAGEAGPERASFSGAGNTGSGSASNDDLLDELQGLRGDFNKLPDLMAMAVKTAGAYA